MIPVENPPLDLSKNGDQIRIKLFNCTSIYRIEYSMAPNEYKATGILFETDPQPEKCTNVQEKQEDKTTDFKMRIVWRNVLYIVYFHISAVYGLYLLLTNQIKFASIVYGEWFWNLNMFINLKLINLITIILDKTVIRSVMLKRKQFQDMMKCFCFCTGLRHKAKHY